MCHGRSVECPLMASYLPYDPQQQKFLPGALQGWLPEGHLAYFISDAMDGLDLSAFHARYSGGGSRTVRAISRFTRP
jgi:hypothetical protein